jgi:hypothetical protein
MGRADAMKALVLVLRGCSKQGVTRILRTNRKKLRTSCFLETWLSAPFFLTSARTINDTRFRIRESPSPRLGLSQLNREMKEFR